MDEDKLINFLKQCRYKYIEKGYDDNFDYHELEKIEFVIPDNKFWCVIYAPTYLKYAKLSVYLPPKTHLYFKSKKISDLFYELKQKHISKTINERERNIKKLEEIIELQIKDTGI